MRNKPETKQAQKPTFDLLSPICAHHDIICVLNCASIGRRCNCIIHLLHVRLNECRARMSVR